MKNSSIKTDNTLESTKIDETKQPNSFSETPRLLRSTASPYYKNIHILCQKPGGKLNKAALNKTGKMLVIAKKLSDKDLLIRSVPNASDTVAFFFSQNKYIFVLSKMQHFITINIYNQC